MRVKVNTERDNLNEDKVVIHFFKKSSHSYFLEKYLVVCRRHDDLGFGRLNRIIKWICFVSECTCLTLMSSENVFQWNNDMP